MLSKGFFQNLGLEVGIPYAFLDIIPKKKQGKTNIKHQKKKKKQEEEEEEEERYIH